MKRLEWGPSLSVGFEEIDMQHQELIETVNSLLDGLRLGGGKASVEHALELLEKYYILHFTSEETLMESFGYPGLEEHRKEHEEFKKKILGFQARACENESENTLMIHQLVEYMTQWLEHHLLYVDMKYALFFKENI
jgi:hemerythrin